MTSPHHRPSPSPLPPLRKKKKGRHPSPDIIAHFSEEEFKSFNDYISSLYPHHPEYSPNKFPDLKQMAYNKYLEADERLTHFKKLYAQDIQDFPSLLHLYRPTIAKKFLTKKFLVSIMHEWIAETYPLKHYEKKKRFWQRFFAPKVITTQSKKFFSQDELDEIKILEENSIENFFEPEKASHYHHMMKCLCPFHDEQTPSFNIYFEDNHYHCFGCGAHGDVIQFLMDLHHLSFKEALSQLSTLNP